MNMKVPLYEITKGNQHESQKVGGPKNMKHKSWHIEVPNWDKYQIRKDLKSMNFFRLETRVFSDSKMRLLSAQGKLIWFYILCELATANRKDTTVFCKVITELCGVRTNTVQKVVSELESLQMLNVLSRDESVPREEKRRKEKSRVEYIYATDALFEGALSLFKDLIIRAKGANAEKRFKEQIISEQKYSQLCIAIKNYESHLQRNAWKKPKQSFATFLGTKSSGFFWEDFIEAESGEEPTQRKEISKSDKIVSNLAELWRETEEEEAASGQG